MTNREPSTPQPDRLGAISGLAEPHRRALYEHIAATGDWVSRDQAADAVGLERGTTAHHLDRLAADGLLEIDYQRLSGRQGPGAGRPAKVYRRSGRQIDVSLPPRDYELAGQLLARAADRSRAENVDITSALGDVARAEGQRLAEQIRARLRDADGRRTASRRRAVLDLLEHHGFEPRSDDDGTVVLKNCPFHELAQQHRDLICSMNHCLLDEAVTNVGRTGLHAKLEPEDGLCCVKLEPGSVGPDEGGDSACWAHLFDDDTEPSQRDDRDKVNLPNTDLKPPRR
jgi:predicted ArsR family transcriptional regulator